MTSEQQKMQEVDIPIEGEISLPTIDIQKYIGQSVKITDVKTVSTEFGYAVQIQTEIVETVEGGKRPIALRGSKLLGLQEDAEGHIGWGVNTALGLFMQKHKAKVLGDLIGQTVKLQAQTKKGSTKEFLTFI